MRNEGLVMHGSPTQVIRRGTEHGVREWLELLEDGKDNHSRDYLAIINHALQVAVRTNRPVITKLLLGQGAGSQLVSRASPSLAVGGADS